MSKSIVVVKRTTPETVISDYISLIEEAGIKDFLPRDKPVILKNNISWHFPFLSANTTPWQLEGVIKGLKQFGYEDIVCVENDTVVTNPYKGEKLNKYTPIFKKYKIPVLYNCRPGDIRWIKYKPKSEMMVLSKVFPKGIEIPELFLNSSIIHLPTMKCHIYTTTTGAMKNAFGGLLHRKRHYTHSVIHETLVDLLTIQKEIHTGIFAVMDATMAGNGPGPRTMQPVEIGLILASADSVAIDAVSAWIMGFSPLEIPYIRLAHQRGLGKGNMKEIEIRGEDITKNKQAFTVGDNLASRVGDLCWFGPLRVFQYLFFRTPLVYLFILGSFLYHDYYWWPIKGKKLMESIYKENKWGKLFASYPFEPEED